MASVGQFNEGHADKLVLSGRLKGAAAVLPDPPRRALPRLHTILLHCLLICFVPFLSSFINFLSSLL